MGLTSRDKEQILQAASIVLPYIYRGVSDYISANDPKTIATEKTKQNYLEAQTAEMKANAIKAEQQKALYAPQAVSNLLGFPVAQLAPFSQTVSDNPPNNKTYGPMTPRTGLNEEFIKELFSRANAQTMAGQRSTTEDRNTLTALLNNTQENIKALKTDFANIHDPVKSLEYSSEHKAAIQDEYDKWMPIYQGIIQDTMGKLGHKVKIETAPKPSAEQAVITGQDLIDNQKWTESDITNARQVLLSLRSQPVQFEKAVKELQSKYPGVTPQALDQAQQIFMSRRANQINR